MIGRLHLTRISVSKCWTTVEESSSIVLITLNVLFTFTTPFSLYVVASLSVVCSVLSVVLARGRMFDDWHDHWIPWYDIRDIMIPIVVAFMCRTLGLGIFMHRACNTCARTVPVEGKVSACLLPYYACLPRDLVSRAFQFERTYTPLVLVELHNFSSQFSHHHHTYTVLSLGTTKLTNKFCYRYHIRQAIQSYHVWNRLLKMG